MQLAECQGTPFLKQAQYLKFKGLNGIRTHKHLVSKGMLNHSPKLARLSKWMSARLRDSWLWVRIPLQSDALNLKFPLLSVSFFTAAKLSGTMAHFKDLKWEIY